MILEIKRQAIPKQATNTLPDQYIVEAHATGSRSATKAFFDYVANFAKAVQEPLKTDKIGD